MDIEITLINQSSDPHSAEIVFFQKNVAARFEDSIIAWKVVENFGRNWSHKFTYPLEFEIAASDSYGNYTLHHPATDGQAWEVVLSTSGDVLQLSSEPAVSYKQVEIKNELSVGSINASVFKDGKLLANQTMIAPGQKAAFEFQPVLYVGVCSQVAEGDVLTAAILSEIHNSFSLMGITKANLILTGGGTGPLATPYKFELIPTA